jgi:DNA polymerase III alpha subunit
MAKLSRAKRKLLKKQELNRKQKKLKDLDNQVPLTQADVDKIFEEHRQKQQELVARRKLKAENETFDHFVNTGEVKEVPEYHDRFLNRQRIGPPLPDIDLDHDEQKKIDDYLINRYGKKP